MCGVQAILGPRCVCKRVAELVQGTGKPMQGLCGVAQQCRASTTVELRWRGACVRCPSTQGAPRATLASANEIGGPNGAYRGSNSSCVAVQGRRCRGLAVACTAELGDGSLQRSSRPLDPTVQLVELLRRCYGGQGGLNCAGGEESRLRRELTVERSRRNSGEAGAGLRGKELGDLPGATAKLLRGLARAKRQRSGVLTAAQRERRWAGKSGAVR